MSTTTRPNLRTTVFDIIEARGIRPGWFAAQCGISYTYLAHIRSGRKPITQTFIKAAQRVLGLPYSALFFEAVSYSPDKVSSTDNDSEGSAA